MTPIIRTMRVKAETVKWDCLNKVALYCISIVVIPLSLIGVLFKKLGTECNKNKKLFILHSQQVPGAIVPDLSAPVVNKAKSKNYYRILGVNKYATQEEIKRAFHKAALRCHPDKNIGHEKTIEGLFNEISEAYTVLSDPKKRKLYDSGVRSKSTLFDSSLYSSPEDAHFAQERANRSALFLAKLQELSSKYDPASPHYDARLASLDTEIAVLEKECSILEFESKNLHSMFMQQATLDVMDALNQKNLDVMDALNQKNSEYFSKLKEKNEKTSKRYDIFCELSKASSDLLEDWSKSSNSR